MWALRRTKRSHVLCSSLVGSIIAFFSSRNRLGHCQLIREVCRSEALDRRRGITAELDTMWRDVRRKAHLRWL
jgi:hypothetical protein